MAQETRIKTISMEKKCKNLSKRKRRLDSLEAAQGSAQRLVWAAKQPLGKAREVTRASRRVEEGRSRSLSGGGAFWGDFSKSGKTV